MPKSPIFLGHFCKGVKILNFSSEIILGNFYRHLATFYRPHCSFEWALNFHWPRHLALKNLKLLFIISLNWCFPFRLTLIIFWKMFTRFQLFLSRVQASRQTGRVAQKWIVICSFQSPRAEYRFIKKQFWLRQICRKKTGQIVTFDVVANTIACDLRATGSNPSRPQTDKRKDTVGTGGVKYF